jgi:hypothetical protein
MIINYYRYVDGILIIFPKTNFDHTLNEFKTAHLKIKFTIEKQTKSDQLPRY